MMADIAGWILLVVLLILHFATGTLDIATENEPQPSYLSQMVLGQKLIKQILRQIQPAKGK